MGGYVSGDKDIIDYLRNYSKSLIYSTALPASVLASAISALDIIKKKSPGKIALENAQYFFTYFKEKCDPNLVKRIILPQPQSAIIPIIVGDDKKVMKISQEIEKQGFLISAIRYPTVPKGTSRVRLTFSSEHNKKDIEKLAEFLLDKLRNI